MENQKKEDTEHTNQDSATQSDQIKDNEEISLPFIDSTIESLRTSGKLKTMLKRIKIDENGSFMETRMHSYLFLFVYYE